jgi:hypothetical protein
MMIVSPKSWDVSHVSIKLIWTWPTHGYTWPKTHQTFGHVTRLANMPINERCQKVLIEGPAMSNRAGDREDVGSNHGTDGTGEI